MSLIDLLVLLIVLAWLTGWGFHLGGSLIHLLLVIAVVVFLVDYIGGRRGGWL